MDSISAFETRVDRLEFKIAKLKAKPENTARTERIERFEERLDAVLNNAPQDQFSISLSQPFPNEQPDFWRYTVEITDSPYDDSFTGGDPLYFQVSGSGMASPRGGSSGFRRRGTFANGDYWEGNVSQTLTTGSSWFSDDHRHPELTATLGIDDPAGDKVLWAQEIDTYAFGNVDASCVGVTLA